MNDASLPVLDLFVIAVYIFGIVVFGSLFLRRSGTIEGFTVGSRSLPGWAVGLSILGTYVSSISFVANPGKSYNGNWNPFVFGLGLPVACWVASRYFIPLYRGTVQTTAYQHLEKRYGYWARAYSGILIVLLQIGRIGVVLYLISIAANHLIGWNPEALMIALGILTIVYTVLGGIEAVIWTDVVQTLVLLGGGVTAVVLLLTRMPGGAMAGFDMAFENSKFSLGAMDFNFVVGGFWLVFVFGVVDNLRNFGVDQNYVQRFLSARSEREAHKSLWLGGLTFIPVSALFFLIGTLLYAYYGSNNLLPEGIAGDQVFPFFINTELPVGLRGLVIAALLAAGMSTLDSSINVSATVWVVDFYRRILRPDASDRTLLRMTRLATVVIGSLGIAAAIAIFRARNQTVLDVWWAISGIFGGGMLGIFLLGLMVKDSTSRGAAIAVAVGSLVILWAALTNPDKGKLLFDTGWLNYPLHSLTIGPVGAGAIVVVGWLESRVFRSAGRES